MMEELEEALPPPRTFVILWKDGYVSISEVLPGKLDRACIKVASSLWPKSKLIQSAGTLHGGKKPAFLKKVLTQLALLITVGDCIRETDCVAVYLLGGFSMAKNLSSKAKVSA